jgi:hypothetical protein
MPGTLDSPDKTVRPVDRLRHLQQRAALHDCTQFERGNTTPVSAPAGPCAPVVAFEFTAGKRRRVTIAVVERRARVRAGRLNPRRHLPPSWLHRPVRLLGTSDPGAHRQPVDITVVVSAVVPTCPALRGALRRRAAEAACVFSAQTLQLPRGQRCAGRTSRELRDRARAARAQVRLHEAIGKRSAESPPPRG